MSDSLAYQQQEKQQQLDALYEALERNDPYVTEVSTATVTAVASSTANVDDANDATNMSLLSSPTQQEPTDHSLLVELLGEALVGNTRVTKLTLDLSAILSMMVPPEDANDQCVTTNPLARLELRMELLLQYLKDGLALRVVRLVGSASSSSAEVHPMNNRPTCPIQTLARSCLQAVTHNHSVQELFLDMDSAACIPMTQLAHLLLTTSSLQSLDMGLVNDENVAVALGENTTLQRLSLEYNLDSQGEEDQAIVLLRHLPTHPLLQHLMLYSRPTLSLLPYSSRRRHGRPRPHRNGHRHYRRQQRRNDATNRNSNSNNTTQQRQRIDMALTAYLTDASTITTSSLQHLTLAFQSFDAHRVRWLVYGVLLESSSHETSASSSNLQRLTLKDCLFDDAAVAVLQQLSRESAVSTTSVSNSDTPNRSAKHGQHCGLRVLEIEERYYSGINVVPNGPAATALLLLVLKQAARHCASPQAEPSLSLRPAIAFIWKWPFRTDVHVDLSPFWNALVDHEHGCGRNGHKACLSLTLQQLYHDGMAAMVTALPQLHSLLELRFLHATRRNIPLVETARQLEEQLADAIVQTERLQVVTVGGTDACGMSFWNVGQRRKVKAALERNQQLPRLLESTLAGVSSLSSTASLDETAPSSSSSSSSSNNDETETGDNVSPLPLATTAELQSSPSFSPILFVLAAVKTPRMAPHSICKGFLASLAPNVP